MGKIFKELLGGRRRIKELEEINVRLESEIQQLIPPEIPEFPSWRVQRYAFVQKLEELGIHAIEVEDNLILNGWYNFTTLEWWNEILPAMMISAGFGKLDIFDCDGYALEAQSECAKTYRLNSLRMCVGTFVIDGETKGHAFNVFPYGSVAGIEGLMLFEPNDGWAWSGIMEYGDSDYEPKYVLV